MTRAFFDWLRTWRTPAEPPRRRRASEAPEPPPTASPPAGADPGVAKPDGETPADEIGGKLSVMVTPASDLFRVSRAGTINVVDLTLPQTLDIHEFDRLNESILAIVRAEAEGQWVLDLSRLDYMGSAALGLMVNLRQQIKQSSGTLVLCGLSPQLLHIFKTCCMERLFKIVKTREDAIAAAAW